MRCVTSRNGSGTTGSAKPKRTPNTDAQHDARTHSAHFSAAYWRKVDEAWASAKPTMDQELANIARRDAQRQGPYIFPADGRMYQDRGETA